MAIVVVAVMIIVGVVFEYANNVGSLLDCFRAPGMLDKCIETYGNVNQINLLP